MSRIALISDIHANLPALEAVMKDIEQLQCDAVYCLGDIVGYNANPSECLEFIRSRQIPTVRGNHDEEAIGEDNPAGMNPVAYSALMWTRQQLSDEQKKWLRRAPFQRILPNEIVLVHATQDKPNSWAYVTNVDTATHSINMLRDNQFLCFNGHTHVPRTFIRHEGSIQEYESGDIQLLKTQQIPDQCRFRRTAARRGPPRSLRHSGYGRYGLLPAPRGIRRGGSPAAHSGGRTAGHAGAPTGGRNIALRAQRPDIQGRKPEIRRHFGGFSVFSMPEPGKTWKATC